MSANEEFDRLPQYLKTSWCLRQDPEDFGRILEDLKGWSVTSISSAYLQFRLEAHRQKEQDCVAAGKLLQSLSSASAAEVIKLLEASVNLDEDIQIIATSLNSATFSQILRDPRLPYPILRAFLALPSPFWVSEKRPVDVDEAILSNEKYIQSRGTEQNKDGKFLITLESLSQILGVSPDHQGPLIITRRDPPKGGFETLDAKRKRSIQIQPTDHAFAETFQRITKNILKGLDWNHIFVAGGMVLTTLLHIDPSKDHDKDVQDCDIDMYLYGLEPEEANRKIEEIYDVWSANLPDSNTQKLVVKNARSITFLAGYPNRRVQIIFKMLTSPIQALLNFDLDACALGFDGKRVLMLPRCSRALEVGYSTFTMNLGDRRSTLEARFFKYADRGFGLRILPSYTRSLEDKVFQKARHVFGVDLTSQELCIDPDRYVLRDRPKEPGLKTLKRIAYLGRDFVHRYCFGEAYSLHPEVGASNADDTSDSFSREATVATNQRVGTWEQFGNFDMISPMSTDRLLADWRGLCGFELFMRRCEAWQLEARGITQFVGARPTENPFDHDENDYDGNEPYDWNESFQVAGFSQSIDRSNNRLFGILQTAICRRLGIPVRRNGYNGYLTRRIRRQVYGPDVASVQEKQITVPLVISHELENHLLADIPQCYANFPDQTFRQPSLIHVYNPVTHDPATSPLPALSDTADEFGNLRYLVVSNENLWAGQHYVTDVFFELFWLFFSLFALPSHIEHRFAQPSSLDSKLSILCLAQYLRCRIILPEIPYNAHETVLPSHLPLREALLFRAWIHDRPKLSNMYYAEEVGKHQMYSNTSPFEVGPPADNLFWEAGDEGEWDEEGVPQWTDAEVEGSSQGDQMREE